MSYVKRLVAVLNWRHGGLVKSYGHSIWRPSLRLEAALRVLDRWQVDEIVLLDISRNSTLDEGMLEALKVARLSTPLAVGGGIRSVRDVERVLQAGADRVVLETLLLDDDPNAETITQLIGRQGVIGSLPVVRDDHQPAVWRPGAPDTRRPADVALEWVERGLVSEVLVKDVAAEGFESQFTLDLTGDFQGLPPDSVIWFGGLDAATACELLSRSETSAVAFGNLLFHSELAAVTLRTQLRRRALTQLRRWSPA